MRFSVIVLFLLFCSCADDDNQPELALEDLCDSSVSNPIGDQCSGDFLLAISQRTGALKHSQNLGYYIQFSIEGTYDCLIVGILCSGEFDDYVDSKVSISGDVHEFEASIEPLVGGQKIVALRHVKIE